MVSNYPAFKRYLETVAKLRREANSAPRARVAHERRALQILREYYGQADCDLLYYDAVRDAESF